MRALGIQPRETQVSKSEFSQFVQHFEKQMLDNECFEMMNLLIKRDAKDKP